MIKGVLLLLFVTQVCAERWVVLSTDANPFYSFFAPIVTWGWSQRIGIRVLLIVTPGVPDVIRNATIWAGGDVLEIPDDSPRAMQLSRLVAAVALDNQDVLTTSDVDMFPIDKDYFLNISAGVNVQGNHPATLPLEFPMCYVTMKGHLWKEVMQLPETNNLSAALAHIYKEDMGWNADQVLLLNGVKNSKQPVTLYPWSNAKRLDFRVDRKVKYRPGLYDSHLLRPGFTRNNWPRLVDGLLSHVLNQTAIEYFSDYHSRFVQE